MTIRTTGTLIVRRRSGRFGAWSEADLKTPEGEFKVKDKVLDQYDEGEYAGAFLIARFYIKTHTTGNRSWSNLMAQLEEFALDRADEKPIPPQEEPGDPAEEEALAQPAGLPATGSPPAEAEANPQARRTSPICACSAKRSTAPCGSSARSSSTPPWGWCSFAASAIGCAPWTTSSARRPRLSTTPKCPRKHLRRCHDRDLPRPEERRRQLRHQKTMKSSLA